MQVYVWTKSVRYGLPVEYCASSHFWIHVMGVFKRLFVSFREILK